MQNMMHAYTLLVGMRKNLPKDCVTEEEIDEYKKILKMFEDEGMDTSMYQIPSSQIKPSISSAAPGRGVKYTTEKFCDVKCLLRKIDALLLTLDLVKDGVEVEVKIGFEDRS